MQRHREAIVGRLEAALEVALGFEARGVFSLKELPRPLREAERGELLRRVRLARDALFGGEVEQAVAVQVRREHVGRELGEVLELVLGQPAQRFVTGGERAGPHRRRVLARHVTGAERPKATGRNHALATGTALAISDRMATPPSPTWFWHPLKIWEVLLIAFVAQLIGIMPIIALRELSHLDIPGWVGGGLGGLLMVIAVSAAARRRARTTSIAQQ